ncbi:MAG TPA: helix-turn-helix domain-containing protein [Bellilinea sp.]|nr:helix-turn-helix domain-containing protein [Bellilinea sp.]
MTTIDYFSPTFLLVASIQMKPPLQHSPHKVVCLVVPGVLSFDLATACETFRFATHENGLPCYQVAVCAEQDEMDAGPFSLRIRHNLAILKTADTIIVPGVHTPQRALTPGVTEALRTALMRGTRIASICTGAFVLAETGLLDGLCATTHWAAAADLQRLYPKINVDPRVLFVDNGQVLTSAGAAAGLDLCLYMIRRDFGVAVASQVARLSVVPLQREGGQAQFIPPKPQGADRSLQPLLTWALANLHTPLSLVLLARQAHTRPRTLHRRFHEQYGESPAQWIIRARVRRAQELLERSGLTVEQIVGEVGLGSAANFRLQFQRIVGVSPRQYRKNFGDS